MLVRHKQTEQLTVIPLKNSWRRIWQFAWERIVIWIANGFTRRNLFAVFLNQESLWYGQCTTCGHSPEYATMQAHARSMKRLATTVSFF